MACENVNLYEQPENPLHKIPIYDQDGDGTCYAYTAAQLIDYYNFKKNPDHKLTSALWVAFGHKYRNIKLMSKLINRITHPRRMFGISEPHQLGYSDINLALYDIRDVGICDADILKASIKKFRLTDKLNDDEFLYLFNLVSENVKQLRKEDAYIEEDEKKRIFDIALNDLIKQREKDILDPVTKLSTVANLNQLRISPEITCGPTSPTPEAEELYSQIMSVFSFDKKNRQLEILKQNAFKDCFQEGAISKVEIPKTEHVGEFFASNQKILNSIDKALDTKNSPAAVGYCSKVMSTPEFTPPVPLGPDGIIPKPRVLQLASSKNVQKCSPHYSLVVARRSRGEQCQYMIRNTYGTHFWNKFMDCTCEKDGKQFDCNYTTHGDQDLKVLGCWINGENLAESTFSVTSFK
jgi:hypothetical protein